MKNISPACVEDLTAELQLQINASRKYRQLGIPKATLRDLVEKNLRLADNPRQLDKVLRHKLHNLVAPYLGDPDYTDKVNALSGLPRELHSPAMMEWCKSILNTHASTRERLPIQQAFYKEIFNLTGTPGVILDLACGMNPFALPWMGLPTDAQYYAFDLHQPRTHLITAFLAHIGQPGTAHHQDILVDPPQIDADVIFFFKEAHRFERRERGASRRFFNQLSTRWLLVSLPTHSLSGQRSMLESDRHLIYEACVDRDWKVSELLFDSEIVFCIRVHP